MSEHEQRHENRYDEPDLWPHEPPAELLDALDRAAARLSELDARGLRISLGIGPDGSPHASVSGTGSDREISSLSLLQLVSGSKLTVPRSSAAC